MARYSGFAATLKVEISSVYTAVAQVRDINGPNMSADPIDVSDRDSAWKQFLAGQRDGGELTFDLVYDPDLASQSASVAGGLLTLFIAGTSNNFRVTFADATPATATFAGFVQSVQPKAPYNDAQTADVTVKVSGQVTFA
jgi:predicted secreted protein